MMAKAQFRADFARKNPLPAVGFQHVTFQCGSLCQGTTFIAGICISLIITLPLLVASTLGNLIEVFWMDACHPNDRQLNKTWLKQLVGTCNAFRHSGIYTSQHKHLSRVLKPTNTAQYKQIYSH